MSRDFFKDAKEKVKKKLEAEEAAAALENIPEGETAPESSVVEDATLPQSPDGDSSLEEGAGAETEVVPDEDNPSTADAVPLPLHKGGDVENLAGSEEVVAEDTTLPQSADADSSLGEGAHVDVEAVMAENKAQKEEIENLRKALEQSGELSKESVVAVAMDDFDDIDMSALVYGDESARKEIPAKLVARVLNAVRSEAAPILKERDEAMHALKVQKAIKVLSSLEDEFPGFGKEADAIEALIGRDKVLASYEDPMHARITAYLVNEGIKAVAKGKAGMSLDELMDIYRKNEEFKAAIEQDRLEQLNTVGALPVVPMGGSFSAAEPYKAEEKPQTMKEAKEKMKKKFLG